MQYREWMVVRTNHEYLQYISKSLNITTPFAQVLISRGLKNIDEIYSFLNPSLELIDPYQLRGVLKAAEIIKEAIKSKAKIFINGDYDADGLTGTAMLYDFLKKLGADVTYHIPHRIHHGHGLSITSVSIAKSLGAKLIITVDCGIRDFEAVSYAKSLGIETIITDHHEPLKVEEEVILPEALSIINPKISENSQYLSLCGAGVAFLLIMALNREIALEYLDLVTIGTYADMVPLDTINRALIKPGWTLIENPIRESIRVLKEISGLNSNSLKGFHLSFCLIPKINAPGRVDTAQRVVNFLISEDSSEINELAHWLIQMNSVRQRIEEKTMEEIEEKIKREFKDEPVVVLWGDWHPGITGTVSGKLMERFNRPVFIFSLQGEKAKGSARAPQGIDLQDILSRCKDLLIRFGGHKQAAGAVISLKNLEEFRKRACNLMRNFEIKNILQLDAAVKISEVNERLVEEIRLLEPFGQGNREPIFGSKELNVLNFKKVGSNHIKMTLSQNSSVSYAVGFDMGDLEFEEGSSIDIAFTPAVNEWEGIRSLQLQLKAIRRSLK
ncbi:MAG: single-stranded-DNA-specific exonuclease RecJ [Thermodesulfovibrio sp.]|nr:single-stranded-DNA-specific exonuclease RecJ [Thermodesulfovibrio sp.]